MAITALGYLAQDAAGFAQFCTETGSAPPSSAEQAAEPAFLAALLSFLAGDESRLLACAAQTGTPPEDFARALATLEPQVEDPW